ncbi:THUMP domain-containing protein 2 isoform X2 [Artibeus jamaicensis]|uniref:THUMP domain-containing protein 2 isoform X2 n=1 Tax=Artibeus jamaicensis TaxID=9417 RepID=UPI00235B19BA|nr:THUMP domain-containing protein 2 isoform X2 [Artibeus jamaicensis]
MAAGPGAPDSGPAAAARFFCTAGRGLEPFLMREVRVRLQATQVEYVSGKVFFTTCSDLNMLKKLKSAERLFLLIKKQFPFNVSSVNKGKIYNEMQRLINDDPESWLNAILIWKNLLELDAKKKRLSQRDANLLKRKVGENDTIITKKLKAEQMQKTQESRECQLEKQIGEETPAQGEFLTNREKFQLEECQTEAAKAAGTPSQKDLTFRVSCRCSGAMAKTFSAQEIFIHLNDLYSIVGIPVFRAPLASRAYIRTAGLRSTIAWAMASVAEIKAGALVLDPMCGLGTILLEAATEWPEAYYVGADVSDSQLQGARDNLKAAGLEDKIALLKVSVVELPLPPESVDVIISDIPFGKKFKLGKDIKSILREMERVLRAGGAVVLLLGEAHCRSLAADRDSSVPPNSKGGHADEPGAEKCLIPEEKTGTSETVSPSLEADNQECPPKMPPFGSLVPVECYKVSLGKTDAFIYKYKKLYSSGLEQPAYRVPCSRP